MGGLGGSLRGRPAVGNCFVRKDLPKSKIKRYREEAKGEVAGVGSTLWRS
jgi:hypothetical protein